MAANFNRIAPVYDQLSFLIYGNKLKDAKEAFIELIPENSRILLMGGGTGNILNDLLKKKPSSIIDYVEPSQRMIEIAQKKLHAAFRSHVNFICGDENTIPSAGTYEVCTSFFVIDCLTPEHAREFSQKITAQLTGGGVWLFSDFFETKNIAHRFLLRFMYRFFKIVSNIETQRLPDYQKIFSENGFAVETEKQFMNGFIRSLVLKRR